MPITIIGAFNATLLQTAAAMLGMNVDEDDADAGSNDEEAIVVKTEKESPAPSSSAVDLAEGNSQEGTAPIVKDETASPNVKEESAPEEAAVADGQASASLKEEPQGDPAVKEEPISISMPKIHINGQGENSGLRKWRSVLKQIQHMYVCRCEYFSLFIFRSVCLTLSLSLSLSSDHYAQSYELYKSGDDGYVLPARTFKEFNGERITWTMFCSQVESREMSKYASSIHVVKTFGDKTNEVMALFEREVMDKKYSVEDADVILSTTHAAKGMEWDNVHVCNDYADIFKLSFDGPLTNKRGGAGSNAKRLSWQFHIKSWGDDVNLLYVACTRAKKLLSIPASLKTFLQDCDMLHDMIRFKKLYRERDMTKNSEIVVFGRKDPLSVEMALDIYEDIVLPLRMENNLETKQRLMTTLVKPLDGDAEEYDDEKAMDCDEEFERFFGYHELKREAAAAVSSTTLGAGPKTQSMATSSIATPASAKSTEVGATAAASSVAVTSVESSAAKKPKLSKAHYVMDDAQQAAALAPTTVARPYDKKEVATRTAKCRECGKDIAVGGSRIGVQVYQKEKREFWCYYFHEQCFPKELLPRLRMDPNRNRRKPAASKKSWNGKKSYGGGGYKNKKYSSWGSGWKKGGGYRKRW